MEWISLCGLRRAEGVEDILYDSKVVCIAAVEAYLNFHAFKSRLHITELVSFHH